MEHLHDCVQMGHVPPRGPFDVVAVYADGGVIARNPSSIGATWAFCWVNSAGERVLERSGYIWPHPDYQCSNNVSEMTALMRALENLPRGWSGIVASDSQVSLGRIFHGWKLKNIPDALWERVVDYRDRLGAVTPLRLDGHPTRAQLEAGVGKRGGPVSEHQVWADKECSRLAKLELGRQSRLMPAKAI